jgi:DNA-binding SARP family transcriptional activator
VAAAVDGGEHSLSTIRVRLFGGFEVWCGDRPVSGFESQKSRALFAYLICQPGRAFSRDHLVGLLWPEKDPATARHALRQAVYNLKSILPGGAAETFLLSNHGEVQWNPAADFWLDTGEFESALRRGTARESIDPHHLAKAAQLYRGELLAGFFVRDSSAFEEWLVGEQERLRSTAVDVLRLLVESYRRRGEYRFGIHYARQLVVIEPLSEEAHRDLMRLCALAGRRGQALAAYERLQGLLDRELGVGPVAETRALYSSILGEAPLAEGFPAEEDREPIGPLVPLVGRREPWEALAAIWQRVLACRAQLTLVEGEPGVGKTRLLKSFLDTTSATRRATILKGRCYELSPRMAYLPFVEVLRNAMAEETDLVERVFAEMPAEVLADLARFVPELRETRPDLPSLAPLGSEAERRRLFDSLLHFLAAFSTGPDGPQPLVLFLDDLHLADAASFDLLDALLAGLADRPVWVIAAFRPAGLATGHPLLTRAGASHRLRLERLDAPAVGEIASYLIGDAQGTELGSFLFHHSAGLPLAVSELINFIWDEGRLIAHAAGGWRLTALPEAADLPPLTGLILQRIRKLPSSTRRLAAVAAVVGQSFEPDVLGLAGEEHPAVVDIGLDLLQERWLIRPFSRHWADSRRERGTGHRASYEFAQKYIRSTLYHALDPARRRSLHGQVAALLEQEPGDGACEALAYHYLAAEEWEKALHRVRQAAARARALRGRDTALHYDAQALVILDRLATTATTEEERERWREERTREEKARESRSPEP